MLNVKRYRCIDRKTRKLTISRDVIFYEPIPKSTINLEDDDLLEGTINGTPINSNTINKASDQGELSETEDFQTPSANDDSRENDLDYEPD